MTGGVVELDLHGMNTYQAQIAVDAALRRAGNGTYRLRLIHPVSAVGTNSYLLRGFLLKFSIFDLKFHS